MMKFKVIAYTFFVPFIWVLLLILQTIVPSFKILDNFSSSVLIGLLVGSLLGRFFFGSKYLTGLIESDNIIYFSYLNQFAQKRQISIQTDAIINIKMKSKIFLLKEFTSIKFYCKENKTTFYLFKNNESLMTETLIKKFPDKFSIREKDKLN